MTKAKQLMDEINATLKSPVLKLGSDPSLKVEYLSTSILPMDILLQGGVPKGRFITIIGDYSTLKSFVGLKTIATTQAAGGTCALIDTEHSFDPDWATSLGVNVDDLILMHPETGELAIDAAEVLVRNGVDLIVFDSVAASLPQAERNKRLHDESVQPARIAQLMSVALRKLTAANKGTAIIWINQYRMNVGVTFGNPETATGGRALPYYSSYIVSIKKVGKVTKDVQMWDGDKLVATKEQVGQRFKATVEKSKLSKPFRDVYFTWNLETGNIDEVGFIIAQGLEAGIITQDRATWAFNGQTWRGKDKFKEAVEGSPEMQQAIKDALQPKPSVTTKKRVVKRASAKRG